MDLFDRDTLLKALIGLLFGIVGYMAYMIYDLYNQNSVIKTETVTVEKPVFIHLTNKAPVDKQDLICLAKNIYFEARNQSRAGKVAVARVVINRVHDSRYPNTVCSVIKQGEHVKSSANPNKLVPKKNRCQFSWYCDGLSDQINTKNSQENYQWKISKEIANKILSEDAYSGVIEGATHYHTDYVNPKWNQKLTYVSQIDNHLFYRWD